MNDYMEVKFSFRIVFNYLLGAILYKGLERWLFNVYCAYNYIHGIYWFFLFSFVPKLIEKFLTEIIVCYRILSKYNKVFPKKYT